MNEQNEEKSTTGKSVWFLVRWATGYVIDLALLVGSFFGAAAVALLLRNAGIGPGWTICLAGTAFAAGMSGRQWARGQYMTHILPEVWEDTIKELVAKAKKEHGE